jgi:hypothetical protein
LVALVARVGATIGVAAGADGAGAGVEHAASKPTAIADKVNWNRVFMGTSFFNSLFTPRDKRVQMPHSGSGVSAIVIELSARSKQSKCDNDRNEDNTCNSPHVYTSIQLISLCY